MKTVYLLFVLAFSVNAGAGEKNNYNCLKNVHDIYASKFIEYWDTIDREFRLQDPNLHRDFNYFIAEQKNSMRMSQITLDYLLKYKPVELRMQGTVDNFVPIYFQYHQEIFRELRTIIEYNKLYLENRSYEHNGKMPNYADYEMASALIKKIEETDPVKAKGKLVMKMAQQPVVSVDCDHLTSHSSSPAFQAGRTR